MGTARLRLRRARRSWSLRLEGEFVPWDDETNDGYDTIEWIGQQAWCDGNVGMSGSSYGGQVQWQAGIAGHPLLKATRPRVMGNNLWDSPHYQDGAFGLGVNAVWGWRTMGRTMQRIDRWIGRRSCVRSPCGRWTSAQANATPPFRPGSTITTTATTGAPPPSTNTSPHYTMPVLQVCGWYDLYAGGMMENFVGLPAARRKRTRPRQPAHHHGSLVAPARLATLHQARPTPATAISVSSPSSIPATPNSAGSITG